MSWALRMVRMGRQEAGRYEGLEAGRPVGGYL